MLSKEELIAQWGEYPVETYALYLSLPKVEHPPGYLQESFGITPANEIAAKELGSEFSVYEDQHPEFKGQLVNWKVVRCEIYHGDDNCAYKAMVICHCDRIGTPAKCDCPKCSIGGSCI